MPGGFRDAYPVDVAPATWEPKPYEGWRESPNVEDRRDEGTVRGYAGGLTAEALKQIRESHEQTMRGLRPSGSTPPLPPQGPLSAAAGINDLPMPNPNGPAPVSTPQSLVAGRQNEQQAIVRAAREAGVDPNYALAVAQRESNFNPTAHSSKTIHGIYQMNEGARTAHGVGDSEDPYTQAKGWMGFQKEVRKEMAGPLGRDPTDAEAYLGHHFGGVRAGKMLKMDPNTPVEAVFTPREMAENPHFAKAGTVGNLNKTLVADIEKKTAEHGGQEYKADFSDGASPAGFENAAAKPPPASATGQQIAADAAAPAAAAGPNSFKGFKDMESAPIEHIPLRTPSPEMSQVGNVVAPVPAMPTAPMQPQGMPNPLQIMLGSPPQPQQDPRRLGMFAGMPI